MKVLFVFSETAINNTGSLTRDQGESMLQQGIEIEYFSIKNKGITGYLKHIFKLRHHLNSNRYDLIHAHYGLCGLVALFAKNGQTKLIISYMGNDLLGNHYRNGRSTFYGKLLVFVNQFFGRYADAVIVKSPSMADRILHNKKTVIPNGLNVELFRPVDKSIALKKTGWDNQIRHILFMADPRRPEKNFSLTEDAMRHIRISNVQLHLLDKIPHEEVVYHFNASDVCLISSFHEGSPNVIKEAMACNCPIVTTDVGDVRWVIGDTAGCFIASFEPKDFAEKIESALKFSKLTNKTVGRERLLELGLDSVTIAKTIIDIYHSVLGECVASVE
jgi:teichuronic acid biosynthesis glycosyltransferase TuaC